MPDLRLALGRDGGILLFAFRLVQTGAQYAHGLVTIFVLAALVLTLDHRAGGQMGDRIADSVLLMC